MNNSGGPPATVDDRVRIRAIALLVFVFGVVLPGCIGFIRVVTIGLQHTPLFGVERTRPFPGYSPDPTLWVTASICTLATVTLFALVIVEQRRHRGLISGIVYGVLSAIVASLNWYVLSI